MILVLTTQSEPDEETLLFYDKVLFVAFGGEHYKTKRDEIRKLCFKNGIKFINIFLMLANCTITYELLFGCGSLYDDEVIVYDTVFGNRKTKKEREEESKKHFERILF